MFRFSVIFNICVIHPVHMMGCYVFTKAMTKKKKFTNLNLKSDMKPKKNWSIFSALYQTHSGDFF